MALTPMTCDCTDCTYLSYDIHVLQDVPPTTKAAATDQLSTGVAYKVWYILFLLLPGTSASTCLTNSRNQGSTFLAQPRRSNFIQPLPLPPHIASRIPQERGKLSRPRSFASSSSLLLSSSLLAAPSSLSDRNVKYGNGNADVGGRNKNWAIWTCGGPSILLSCRIQKASGIPYHSQF